MGQMLGIGAIILMLILTVVLWSLYHKCVNKIYFGNMFMSIVWELLCCFVVSMLIVGAVINFLGWIFSGIIKLIGIIIKIAIVVGGIGGVIYIIYKIVSSKNKDILNKFTGEKNNNTDTKENTEVKDNKNKTLVCSECGAVNSPESIFCENCGSKLSNDEQENAEELMRKRAELARTLYVIAEKRAKEEAEQKVEEQIIQEKRCPECGNLIGDEDVFCGDCGAKLNQDR